MQKLINTLRWEPPQSTAVRRRGIYLLHGAGEHAARYEPLALQLAQAGFRVATHDHPGHGQSAGKRGVIDPPGSLITQAAIQCQQFAVDTGCAPILFGHSLGAVAATELVLDHQLPVAGLILASPAFTPFMRWRDHLQVRILAHLAPTFTVERPYRAVRLTTDEKIQKQAESDPLNHGYKSASLVDWLCTSGKRQLANAEKLMVDTLMLIAPDDPVVDARSMQEFAGAVDSKVTVHSYEGYLHEILNETPERVERVHADILQWLEQRYPDQGSPIELASGV